MRERRLSFKQAVNESIRAGLRPLPATSPFRTLTFPMGEVAVSLDKALRLAADLEDEEIVRKLALRK